MLVISRLNNFYSCYSSAMRDFDRLSKIRTSVEASKVVEVTSAPIRKFIRKDFNFVSCYMFFYRQRAEQISKAFDVANAAIAKAEELGGSFLNIPSAVKLEAETFTVRLVSPEAGQLLKLLLRLDKINTALVKAEVIGRVGRSERNGIIKPALAALNEIKIQSTGQPERQPRKQPKKVAAA